MSSYDPKDLRAIRKIAETANSYTPFDTNHPAFAALSEQLLPHVFKMLNHLEHTQHTENL